MNFGNRIHIMKTDRILVIEDRPIDHERLCKLLATALGTQEVAWAKSIQQARQLLRLSVFDLAFIDLGLPDGLGVDLVSECTLIYPQMSSIVMSSMDQDEVVVQSIEKGAVGYLLKNRDDSEIISLLRTLREGGAPIDSSVARIIISRLQSQSGSEAVNPVQRAPKAGHALPDNAKLSARELEMLNLVSRGFSNREIAQFMGITVNSVESNAKDIYRKLAVRNRTEAVFEARTMGLLR